MSGNGWRNHSFPSALIRSVSALRWPDDTIVRMITEIMSGFRRVTHELRQQMMGINAPSLSSDAILRPRLHCPRCEFSHRIIHKFGGRLIRINPAESSLPTRFDVGFAAGAVLRSRRLKTPCRRWLPEARLPS